MKFQPCCTQSDYFGQMKSNTASFNAIRRIDIAEFSSDWSAPTIRSMFQFTLWWHPCAVSLGNVSVVSQRRGKWRADLLQCAAQAKVQGTKHSQGFGESKGSAYRSNSGPGNGEGILSSVFFIAWGTAPDSP